MKYCICCLPTMKQMYLLVLGGEILFIVEEQPSSSELSGQSKTPLHFLLSGKHVLFGAQYICEKLKLIPVLANFEHWINYETVSTMDLSHAEQFFSSESSRQSLFPSQ